MLQRYALSFLVLIAGAVPCCSLYGRTIPEAPTAQQTSSDCEICFTAMGPEESWRLGCGHTYCKDCLGRIVDGAIAERSTMQLNCPTPTCRSKMTHEDVRSISTDVRKHQQIIEIRRQEEFNQNPAARHCPTPNCTHQFLHQSGRAQRMTCPQCGEVYCKNCLLEHPEVITCQEARTNRAQTEDANEGWLRNNTRECPRCHAHIERIAGCNHMTCTRCRHEFCWLCMRNWPGYGQHTCPTFGGRLQQNRQSQTQRGTHIPAQQPRSAQEQQEERRPLTQEEREGIIRAAAVVIYLGAVGCNAIVNWYHTPEVQQRIAIVKRKCRAKIMAIKHSLSWSGRNRRRPRLRV